MESDKLRLGDLYAKFDNTGALCFFLEKGDKRLCWVNYLGVEALRKFIDEHFNVTGGGE